MPASSLLTLREQYKLAVELYEHEDDLNWRKLNHLFYINIGLWAVIGFIAKFDSSNLFFAVSPYFLLVMVSLIGLILSLAFGVALWFGVNYMHSRKDVVVAIEKILVQHGGRYIVSTGPENGEEKRFLKRSPTTWVLRSVPILLSIAWVIIFIMSILGYKS